MAVPYYATASIYWEKLLEPYLKNTQILLCPSANGLYPSYGVLYSTFALNPYFAFPISCNLSTVQFAADAIMLMESQTAAGAAFRLVYCPTRYGTDPGAGGYYGIPYPGRHNNGSNCAFADGHAKWLADSYLLSKTSECWTKQPPFLY